MSVIAVVDDEERWLSRFKQTIQKASNTRVVGASTGGELLAALEDDDSIRIVLFDQDLGTELGSDLVTEVRANYGNERILFGVTSSTDPEDVERFRTAGADGMASKAALRHGLPDAIARLHAGDALLPDDRELFEVPLGFVADWLFGE